MRWTWATSSRDVFLVHAALTRVQYRGSTAWATRAKNNGLSRGILALSVPDGRSNLYVCGSKGRALYSKLASQRGIQRHAGARAMPRDNVVDPSVPRARAAVARAHLWPCWSA